MKRLLQMLPVAALCIGFTSLYASPAGDLLTMLEPATAVVFETPRQPRAADIDPTGGNQVAAFDLTAGKRIDIEVRAAVDVDLSLRAGNRPQVAIHPQQTWPAGHEVLVVLSKHFPLVFDGDDYEARMAGAKEPSQRAYFARMNAALAQAKVQRSFVQSASLFTVPAIPMQSPTERLSHLDEVPSQLAQVAVRF